jgi:hypothetical protein
MPTAKPTKWMILSLLCSAIALFFIPLLFGGLAILFGFQAYKEERNVGMVCMQVGGLSLIIGVVIGAVLGMQNIPF